ncbi:hypothetical protein EB169_04620, partial [archaeon]|nr:hypothetical protein [archaeon]
MPPDPSYEDCNFLELSQDAKNLGYKASYSIKEILDEQVGIASNTINDLDNALIPGACSKVDAIRKISAAVDQKIIRRANAINTVVQDILNIHRDRLANEDLLEEYNNSMPSTYYDEETGEQKILIDGIATEVTEEYFEDNWNPYNSDNGQDFLEDKNKSKWSSNIELVKTPKIENGDIVYKETQVDSSNDRGFETKKSIVYDYKWEVVEPCTILYRNNENHFLVDEGKEEILYRDDIEENFDDYLVTGKETGSSYNFDSAKIYEGPKRLCPMGDNIPEDILPLIGLTEKDYDINGNEIEVPLHPIENFGTKAGPGETIINKVDERIRGYDYDPELDTPLTESNIILGTRIPPELDTPLIGSGASAEYFELPHKYDVGHGNNFNDREYTVEVISFDGNGNPIGSDEGGYETETVTLSGEFNENNADYINFIQPRLDWITSSSNRIKNRLIEDANTLKNQSHKVELNLWALRYARKESENDIAQAVDSEKILKRYGRDLTEQFDGALDVNNDEIKGPPKFEDLTDDQKRELSLSEGLGIPKIEIITDANGDPIPLPGVDQNDPNLTDEERYYVSSDSGFNDNFDDEKIKKHLEASGDFGLTGDYVLTKSGSLVIYNSVGTAKTYVGSSTATKKINRGGISTSNYAVGVVTIVSADPSSQPEYIKSRAAETQNRVITPPTLSGVSTSYNGFIGTEGRSWMGIYSQRFYGTLVGSAASIFTSPDTFINATGEHSIVMGFGSDENTISPSTPMISTSFTYNVDTSTLSVPNISVGGTITYDDVTNVDSLGIITARSHLNVSGNASVGGGLTVTGALNVCGNTTLSSALTVSGNTILKGTLNVSGNASVGGGLTVTGA